MNIEFKNFIELIDCVNDYGSIIVPEAFSWAHDISRTLPKLDLGLPTVEKRAKIEMVFDKRNPIYVQLSDGSKLFFTLDEFNRIEGKPQRGKTMVVTMQRLPEDRANLPSQITKCQVI